jgi:uncharacterized Zn-binding protein involved in type VI secretion
MAGVARVGDIDTGHGTYAPDTVASGSPNVFANGMPVARTGDPHGVHKNTVLPFDVHPAFCGAGSGTVFANGSPVFRGGDPVDDATQAGCSGNVSAGG